MRLRDMNTVQLAAALCDMAPHIEAIGSDEAVNNLIKNFNQTQEGRTVMQTASTVIAMLVPALLERHRAHTFAILSVMTGKTEKEIEAQNGFQTIRDVKAVLDKDLIELFKSST